MKVKPSVDEEKMLSSAYRLYKKKQTFSILKADSDVI